MTSKMLDEIKAAYPLEKIDVGEYSKEKLNGMTFNISAYYAKGLGHVSVMTASGFLGLMKMDTLIIAPYESDMTLFSYDRVHAMGNDTLIFELYDTLVGETDISALEGIKSALDHPDHDLGEHWYDSIKLPESVSKKGKKKNTPVFDAFALEYLRTYLTIAKNTSSCDADAKKKKASVYVEGLLTNGGPSTDVFLKALGREKTEHLFRNYLFGTAK